MDVCLKRMGVALGYSPQSGGRLTRLIEGKNIAPYLGPELREKLENPIVFQGSMVVSGTAPNIKLHGFDVTILIDLCKAIVKAPAMIVFCSFEQQFEIIEKAKKYGLVKYINLVFRKNFSAQVLKANMRPVGNCEYALLLYRDKLPKFNNCGKMVFNCLEWEKDKDTPKIHPTQKPVKLLEKLIKLFTDEGEVVIDPCAGSGTTLLAAMNCGRRAYGFEIKKDFYRASLEMLSNKQKEINEIKRYGFSPTLMDKGHPTLFKGLKL